MHYISFTLVYTATYVGTYMCNMSPLSFDNVSSPRYRRRIFSEHRKFSRVVFVAQECCDGLELDTSSTPPRYRNGVSASANTSSIGRHLRSHRGFAACSQPQNQLRKNTWLVFVLIAQGPSRTKVPWIPSYMKP